MSEIPNRPNSSIRLSSRIHMSIAPRYARLLMTGVSSTGMPSPRGISLVAFNRRIRGVWKVGRSRIRSRAPGSP